MELKNYVTQESAWLDIISPDGIDTVAQFELAGRDSKVLKRRQQELAKKRQGKKTISAAEEEADTIKTIALCTLNWRDVNADGPSEEGYLLNDGKKLECNLENATFIYQEYPWIAEQAIEFLAERSNFLAR